MEIGTKGMRGFIVSRDWMFVSLAKFKCWSPALQCNGIWRWSLRSSLGLDDAMWVRLHDGIHVLTRRGRKTRNLSLSLPPEDIVRSQCLRGWKRAFVSNQILIPDFSASSAVTDKCLVFKPPGQWHFVIAAWADQHNREINTTYGNWTSHMIKQMQN